MQSAAGRRAFGFLAAKMHAPRPLSPRESAQLLSLLTSSFNRHLDRAHPPPPAEPEASSSTTSSGRLPPPRRVRNASPGRAQSSQSAASQHIESILTNPLFAARPQRRSSDPQGLLRDPLGWFLDQAAMGAADLSTAATCLKVLQAGLQDADYEARQPATHIAKWLRSSGLDASREFVDYDPAQLLEPLVKMLVHEGEDATAWAWLAQDRESRLRETGLDSLAIIRFRTQTLRAMVRAKAQSETDIDATLSLFLRAVEMRKRPEYGFAVASLRPAAFDLVNHILAHPESVKSPQLYDLFLQSTPTWTSRSRAIDAILWLHHPTKPTAHPGMEYIQDPKGIASLMRQAPLSMRKLLVHLCLGTAHQSLVEQRFSDAQFALEFARDHFPDLLGADTETPDANNDATVNQTVVQDERRRREDINLELLDRLLPT